MVPEANRGEYLSVVRELAGLASRRGQHLWIFENRDNRGQVFEFSEGPGGEDVRSVAPVGEREKELVERLKNLVVYQDDPSVVWEELSYLDAGV